MARGARGRGSEISRERGAMRVRVRVQSRAFSGRLHDLVQRRARFAMGRFARAIREVSLLLAKSDEAVCRERIRCALRVGFVRGKGVRIVQAGGDVGTAVDAALERTARAVRRQLELEGRVFGHDDEDEASW